MLLFSKAFYKDYISIIYDYIGQAGRLDIDGFWFVISACISLIFYKFNINIIIAKLYYKR